jgi:poly(3-hydroxybutyrate) depolymerase
VGDEPLCVNGPELPYFNAVQNWVEAHYCVDMGNEFMGGGSSGEWEAFTVGCDAATLRGSISVAGGKREHRWPCTGPIAAFMIVADDDTNNPVGPLPTINTELDSYGAVPARDDLLQRNGCVGTNTTVLDPAYPACKKYTGCPVAYPVVWCEFPSGGHDNPTFNGVNYTKAMWPFLTGLPPAP